MASVVAIGTALRVPSQEAVICGTVADGVVRADFLQLFKTRSQRNEHIPTESRQFAES